MKNVILNNWHGARIIRLVIGLLIAGYAIYTHDGMLGMLSSVFILAAALNTSCCGIGGCNTPHYNAASTKQQLAEGKEPAVQYTEIK
ncbi:MAG TPA: hypothetical protein PKD90_10515 [Phnomibacter sp.]|nr:hypothetical protein [Phnomibacter sp.]